ncbi:MAG: sensor histidine kinase, partial [Chroococcales cyanobacterium]
MSAFEHLIFVNEAQAPVGVLDVGCLLLNLLQGETTNPDWGLTDRRNGLPHTDLPTLMAHFCAVVGNCSQNGGGPDAPTAHDLDLWQQSVAGLSPGAIASVERVSAQMSLTQFWERLQTQDPDQPRQPQWVVMDAEDKCLGLLDFPRAIAALAQNTRLVPQNPGVPESQSGGPESLSGVKAWPFGAVRPLGELLEEIPLPMKLQTSAGKVAIYNQAWRTYFDSFSEPETDPSGEVRTPSQPTSHREPDHLEHPDSESLSRGLCPLPKGSDRVWQFVKIPIGLAFSERSPHLSWQDSPFDPSKGPEFAGSDSTGEHPPVSASIQSDGSQTESLWLVLAQDVTVQQQVAKELAAKNADLMQLNRLKDEFLACISHELKTPLTAVLGLSSLLKERTLGPLTDRQARYAQMIYTSGRHLMNVVNDILDLTRIES